MKTGRFHTENAEDTARMNEVSGGIVDSALWVHKEIGPGLLESVDEVILADLRLRGISLGLLINFGGEFLKGNIERIVVGEVPDLKISSAHSA